MVDYGAPRRCARHAARARVFESASARSDAASAATGTDQLLLDIADYVIGYELEDPEALQIARYALLDSLGARATPLRLIRGAVLTPSWPRARRLRAAGA